VNRHDPITPLEQETIRILVHDGHVRLGIVLDYKLNSHVVQHPLCPVLRGAIGDEVWAQVKKITKTMRLEPIDIDGGRLLHGPFEGLGYRILEDDTIVNRFGRILRPQKPKYGAVRFVFDTKKLGPKTQAWTLKRLKEIAW
jgi:hypothetical protein